MRFLGKFMAERTSPPPSRIDEAATLEIAAHAAIAACCRDLRKAAELYRDEQTEGRLNGDTPFASKILHDWSQSADRLATIVEAALDDEGFIDWL